MGNNFIPLTPALSLEGEGFAAGGRIVSMVFHVMQNSCDEKVVYLIPDVVVTFPRPFGERDRVRGIKTTKYITALLLLNLTLTVRCCLSRFRSR
jgi:hypothetical protein